MCNFVISGENVLQATSFVVTVEQVPCIRVQGLLAALQVLFAAFYVFNFHYPVEVGATLEFIQRYQYTQYSEVCKNHFVLMHVAQLDNMHLG